MKLCEAYAALRRSEEDCQRLVQQGLRDAETIQWQREEIARLRTEVTASSALMASIERLERRLVALDRNHPDGAPRRDPVDVGLWPPADIGPA